MFVTATKRASAAVRIACSSARLGSGMTAVVLERVAYRIAPYLRLHNQAAEIGRRFSQPIRAHQGRGNHVHGVAIGVVASQSVRCPTGVRLRALALICSCSQHMMATQLEVI